METGQKFVLRLSYFDLMLCCIYLSVVDRGFNPIRVKPKAMQLMPEDEHVYRLLP
jgi:hypothetical protein